MPHPLCHAASLPSCCAQSQHPEEAGRPAGSLLPAGTYARRILEQLLVDLSWASSRMEGNTYDILQAEQLLRYGEEASGKDRKEAVMILNHKEAIQYLVDNIANCLQHPIAQVRPCAHVVYHDG